jgi:hypothetical protein
VLNLKEVEKLSVLSVDMLGKQSRKDIFAVLDVRDTLGVL